MSELRIFHSSGNCFFDSSENPDQTWDLPAEEEGPRMRNRMLTGLHIYQNQSRGYLICSLKATLDVEQHFIVEFQSDAVNIHTAFIDTLETVTSKTDMIIQEYDKGIGSIYWNLTRVDPKEPIVSFEDIQCISPPYQYGVPDEHSALELYKYFLEKSDRVLVSRSGVSKIMPDAEVVIIPHEADRFGIPINETAKEPSDSDLDDSSSASGVSDSDHKSFLSRARSFFDSFRSH